MRDPSGEMKAGLKRGSWSLEEDEMLRSYINRYGIWNWSQMPKFAGLSRSGKSCRLRWMNYLKPNIKRGNFSQQDEEIILHFHSLMGNRWSTIASKLPGRSDNEIKNYWHTHLKKRATHNLVHETSEQNDMNVSLMFEADKVERIQDNHANDLFESHFPWTSEDDSSSSSSSTTSKDLEVDFKADYYDVGSPGTADDFRSFWKQLCPLENLELGKSHQDISFDPVFQYSYHDTTNPYNFYNNDYDTIKHLS